MDAGFGNDERQLGGAVCQWIGDLDGNAGSEAAKSRWAGVFQLSRQEFLQLQNLRKLLIWGRNRFLELRGLKLEEEEEAWLEVLSGFSLRDLETLVEKDREGALASMGDLGTKSACLLIPGAGQRRTMPADRETTCG